MVPKNKFRTKWNGTPFEGEKNSGEVKVEKAGYIPTRQQIDRMILAGRRLNEYREENYDQIINSGKDYHNDDVQIDPTRRKDYDLADATQDSFRSDEAYREAKALIEEKKKTQEKKKDKGDGKNDNPPLPEKKLEKPTVDESPEGDS